MKNVLNNMTNKEELREKWKEEYSSTGHCDCGNKYLELEDVFDFFWDEIEQIRKEDRERVVGEIEKVRKPLKCFDEECPFCLRGLSRKCSQIQNIEELNDVLDQVLSIIKQNE